MGALPFLMVSVACAGVIGGLTRGLLLKMPCRFGGPNGVASSGCLLWQLTQFCWKIAAPRLAFAFIDRLRRVGKTDHITDNHRSGSSQEAYSQEPTTNNHFPNASGIYPAIKMINHAACPGRGRLRLVRIMHYFWTIATCDSTLLSGSIRLSKQTIKSPRLDEVGCPGRGHRRVARVRKEETEYRNRPYRHYLAERRHRRRSPTPEIWVFTASKRLETSSPNGSRKEGWSRLSSSITCRSSPVTAP